jgi:hypothetical protein
MLSLPMTDFFPTQAQCGLAKLIENLTHQSQSSSGDALADDRPIDRQTCGRHQVSPNVIRIFVVVQNSSRE